MNNWRRRCHVNTVFLYQTLALPLILCTPSAFAQRVITTLAGADWLFPGNGQTAINAPLGGNGYGLDLATDANGNYYICDGDNLMIMRVGSDGILNVIAGNGVNSLSGDGGLAVNAGLAQPVSITVDSVGNLYIGDYSGRIREVTLDGTIHTIAGNGVSGFSGDNGPAIAAELYNPSGLAVDSAGNIYIADTNNSRIRKITPDGIIRTIAGTGTPGYTGDNGPGVSAQLHGPTRIALDSVGNLYIADVLNARVRKLDTTGVITTIAGGGLQLGDGIPATDAPLIPLAVAADQQGDVYIIDAVTQGVRKVSPKGVISTVAGGSGVKGFAGDGGAAQSAVFDFFYYAAVALDDSGQILIADDRNERVRKITADGLIHTIAGNSLFHYSGNGGPATSATLVGPTSVIKDKSGNVFITEPLGSRIRRIAPDGTISVYAGTGALGYAGDLGPANSASLGFPEYLAFDPNGTLYFADEFDQVIRKIDSNGMISTYAGSGAIGFSGDGDSAAQATFRGPSGIDFDTSGELVIADSLNNRVRVVFPSGDIPSGVCKSSDSCIVTIAGDGNAAYSGDNGPAPNAELNNPVGIRIHDNNIYLADSGNNRIRKIDFATLTITTVAGNGQAGYTGDGGPATQSSLSNPQSVAFDASNNMYIADEGNGAIRMVTPDGTISTLVGFAKQGVQGDGGPLSSAGLGTPTDVFVDSSGRILIADSLFNRVRVILTTLPTFQASPSALALTAPASSLAQQQALTLGGSLPGIPFSASSNSSWLQVTPPSGTMPVALQISADPSLLTANSYQASITITAPNASPSTQSIPVTFTVTAAGQPSLNVLPTSLTFAFVHDSAAQQRNLSVANLGGGSLSFVVSTATGAGGAWLKASPSTGTLNAFGSTSVAISVDPTGLIPGVYTGIVTATSAPAEKVTVPVTVTISAVSQTIQIPQTGFTFFTVEGGGLGLPQFFNVLNAGVGQMIFSANASTRSGGDWLSLFPSTGVSDASSLVVPQIRVDANPAGLPAGVYYGVVQVSSMSAVNSPQYVSIVFNVLPPNSSIGPLIEPTGLIFTGSPGGESPGSQTIFIESTTTAPLAFRSSAVGLGGQNWFTVTPAEGTVTQVGPLRVVIQPRTNGLAPGVYRGTLSLSFSDGSTRAVNLVLILPAPTSASKASFSSAPRADNSCQPTRLVPVFTMLSAGSSLPAGWPGQVAVDVVDDCANPMTSGDVIVSFSNGDPPIRLISLKDGSWAGTWTPGNSASQLTVTATASIPELMLQGQVQARVGSQNFSPAPVVGPGGILNAASFALQSPLAPGSLMSVFGSSLAQNQDTASSLPLPLTLAGSTLVLGGKTVPLLYTSSGQVNGIVPYGVAVNTSQQLLVSTGSTVSTPEPVTLAAAAPGVFTADGSGSGQGIIEGVAPDQSQTLADAGHPVTAGQAVVIYCTGLGEVEPSVLTGAAVPLTQLSSTVTSVSVTIGGLQAKVLFAGLTPGFAGLYQVNVIVPNGVPAGSSVPVVIAAAGQQSQPVTIAVQW